MLKKLYIDNYALIDKIHIDFTSGLSIITGETGAGKSILIGALSLILGKRAETFVLQDKTRKCIVEGHFNITDYHLQNWFEKNDIDYDPNTLIRREINPKGKSRSFVNDIPVTLDVLNDLSNYLIDIHSQHQNLNLSNYQYQLFIVDIVSNTQNVITHYKQEYATYIDLVEKLEVLEANYHQSKNDLDYLQFQYDQLENARLIETEQEELELEQQQLTHAEEIKSNLSGANYLLQEDENNIVNAIKTALNQIIQAKKFLPQLEDVEQRLNSAYIELKDIAEELDHENERVQLDPERLNYLNERLSIIYDLEKKHHVQNIQELLHVKNQIEKQINEIGFSDQQIDKIKNDLRISEEKLKTLSGELTTRRTKSFLSLKENIESILKQLGIPHAKFEIQHELLVQFNSNGKDRIRFLFSANKNAIPQDISKIASGGEISRLMLAIKSLITHSSGLPTIILDEIDAGISGEIANKVGNIIKEMSHGMQVINITHLPQVAGKGDFHYLVYKEDGAQKTVTQIKLLTTEERKIEIAKMLSGNQPTEAAIANANDLLSN